MPYDLTKNPYSGQTATKDSPASRAAAVTPHNTSDLAIYAKALLVSVAGTLRFLPAANADGDTVDVNVVVGQVVPLLTRRVLQTGTTATVIALFD